MGNKNKRHTHSTTKDAVISRAYRLVVNGVVLHIEIFPPLGPSFQPPPEGGAACEEAGRGRRGHPCIVASSRLLDIRIRRADGMSYRKGPMKKQILFPPGNKIDFRAPLVYQRRTLAVRTQLAAADLQIWTLRGTWGVGHHLLSFLSSLPSPFSLTLPLPPFSPFLEFPLADPPPPLPGPPRLARTALE